MKNCLHHISNHMTCLSMPLLENTAQLTKDAFNKDAFDKRIS